ncbi:MAG TPA: A/G-specific adenine glycosylase [Gemmatimonadales bacterium]|nr:A/G-specific adenine glycosylase [Gemmatimonadales bacterium]
MPPKSTPAGGLVHGRLFRRRLISWFRRHGRNLPWRGTRDPYHVLVSEVMLQQTQVSRVEGYYGRFLAEFPDVKSLARASPARVREQWDGLGYYRRAANLHRLARKVVASFRGRIPDDVAALRALPGVGRYTAGAVASFAFERAEPAVDTNVARVLRRAFHPRAARNARGDQRLWDTAAALLPRAGRGAWSFNQAIMELGAMICTARVARCDVCPVAELCKTGKRRTDGPAPTAAARRRSAQPAPGGR